MTQGITAGTVLAVLLPILIALLCYASYARSKAKDETYTWKVPNIYGRIAPAYGRRRRSVPPKPRPYISRPIASEDPDDLLVSEKPMLVYSDPSEHKLMSEAPLGRSEVREEARLTGQGAEPTKYPSGDIALGMGRHANDPTYTVTTSSSAPSTSALSSSSVSPSSSDLSLGDTSSFSYSERRHQHNHQRRYRQNSDTSSFSYSDGHHPRSPAPRLDALGCRPMRIPRHFDGDYDTREPLDDRPVVFPNVLWGVEDESESYHKESDV